MQKLENLHYYVLSTQFPLLVHLDDQCSEFLKSWMAYLEFNEFPGFIEYYTTIGNGTLLRKSTLQSKNVQYLRILNTLCKLPNHISWTTHPTKSYT